MLRRLLLVLSVLATAVGSTAALAAPVIAVPDRPPDDPGRGLVYEGLRRGTAKGACRGNFQVDDLRDGAGRPLCTHGPDPAPPGVDVRGGAATGAAGGGGTASGTAAAGSLVCDGDGTSGYRVQLLYVHASDVADRSAALAANFTQWAAGMDQSFSASAAETGGDRHVRFVHDGSCAPVVTDVTVSTTGDDGFSNTVKELRNRGFTRSDRKYVAWVDARRYCGIAQVYYDDRAGADNASNGSASVPGEVARIDAGCWGQANPVEAHELMHTLGGVQTSAPHATPNNHCTDEYDRMCYSDASGVKLTYPCAPSHEALFDCRHDDYYHTAPPAGSYLATHWNTASSRFLIGGGGGSGTTTTTVSTGAVKPGSPKNLAATAQTGAIVLDWAPPADPGTSPVTKYKVYRGTSSNSIPILVTVKATGYTDTGVTPGVTYYYQVAAVSAAGRGPRSGVASATAS